jgi:hypothetical protein
MTMGQWGFHFERTVTWWEQGKAWLDYVARCQFLLQQGRAVADAAYFCGESAPVEMRVGDPVLPAGYDYDAINADVLLHRAAVKNGRLTLPDGMSYAALILPPSDADLTPQLLQRILELVREGATVVGPPPQHSPSLEDYPACDARVKELAGELWGKCDGRGVTENVVGRGRVIWGRSLADVFSARALKPDFEFHGRSPASRLVYVHRVAGDSDIYFVSNQRPQFETAECTFRVNGKAPEFWHPDTDTIEPAPIWSEQDGRVTVRLQLDPAGSAFVVCRRPAGGADHAVAASDSASKPEAPASPKVEIRHAVYEAVDGAGSNDVTARLTELVRSGETAVSASNEQMGGDPTYNHVKQLRVEYTLDGKSINVTVPENETLTLAAPPAAGGFPAWQPVVGREGRLLVKTWTNGVFELRTARGRTLKVEARDVPAPREIAGAWNVRFPPNWEAPAQVQLDKLLSWSDHADRGIRYFSGTATYGKEIEVPAEWLRDGRELWLDLGRVKNFADVALNGQNLGTFWKPPFRVNLTSAAKPGANRLEVKVTNLWPNRLIGDEQLPDDRQWTGKRLASWPDWLLAGKPSPTGRLTFTTWHHWTKDAPLLESGLLGPVTLQAAALLPAE